MIFGELEMMADNPIRRRTVVVGSPACEIAFLPYTTLKRVAADCQMLAEKLSALTATR